MNPVAKYIKAGDKLTHHESKFAIEEIGVIFISRKDR